MPSRKKYRLPATPNSSNSGFLWLLIILGLLTLAWVWWRSGHPVELKKRSPKKSAKQTTNSTPAVASISRTNGVVAARLISSDPPPATFNNGGYPRPAQNILEAQLAMERLGISSGSLDGKSGSQTRAALRAFQVERKIPATGEFDAITKSTLMINTPPLLNYLVASNDLARLQPLGKTWLAKSQQSALDYETLLELVAEKSHAHPALIRRLNPSVNWTNEIAVGTTLQIPDATRIEAAGKALFIKISLGEKVLEAFDDNTNLLAHFPCSIAQRVEKRPVGELHVAVIAPNPNYTFDPAIFPESPEAQQLKTKLVLPPGPNNPVGAVWIGLDKPGYGMHGTPSPELVGRTESHGCFRLANWNAEYLLKLVWIGMPVYVEP